MEQIKDILGFRKNFRKRVFGFSFVVALFISDPFLKLKPWSSWLQPHWFCPESRRCAVALSVWPEERSFQPPSLHRRPGANARWWRPPPRPRPRPRPYRLAGNPRWRASSRPSRIYPLSDTLSTHQPLFRFLQTCQQWFWRRWRHSDGLGGLHISHTQGQVQVQSNGNGNGIHQ